MGKISGFTLYWRYLRMHFLAGLQYKGWFLQVLQTLITVVLDPIGMLLLFSRFGGIGEWTMERILLVYALAVTSFGLAETFCRGFDSFPFTMVRMGTFDRVMLRPRSTFLQVIASVFHLHRLSRVAGGMAAILWCLYRLGVAATPFNVLLLLLALAGGCALYMGVFVFTSGVAFFSVKGLEWIYLFTNAGYQVTRCPVPYMPRVLRGAFTFLLPILVISYYPASVLCGWGEPVWRGLMALPAGLAVLAASLLMWHYGVAHYRSVGS